MATTPADDRPDYRFRTVFETDNGAIRLCDCCGCLQVWFGNAVFALDTDELGELRSTIAAIDNPGEQPGPWKLYRVVIPLASSGAGFAFSRPEIAELHRLLVGAELLLDIDPDGEQARHR